MQDSSRRKIRVSIGSAIALNLIRAEMREKPSTTYLLTYYPGKCSANCGFCSQARLSTGRSDLLSRVTWPLFQLDDVIENLEVAVKEGFIRRTCIQALNYPGMLEDVLSITAEIRSRVDVPVSLSCQPLGEEHMKALAEAGLDTIGIPIDTATEELFEAVKGAAASGPYNWKSHIDALRRAVEVFGKGRVYTHLIVGLGETDEDIVHVIQEMVDMDVFPGLFAFTPLLGTMLEGRPQPQLSRYRRLQLAHYLVTHWARRFEAMKFEGRDLVSFGVSSDEVRNAVRSGRPFLTSGCPHCNRPYYNERPSGPIYNYARPLDRDEILAIEREMALSGLI